MSALVGVVETRKILGSEGPVSIAVFYLLALTSIAIFCYGWIRRYKKYRRGRSASRPWWKRPAGPRTQRRVNAPPSLSQSLSDVLTNRPVRQRKRLVGTAHLALFWGFLGLLAATTIVGIQYDVLGHAAKLLTGSQIYFFQGRFYLVFKLLVNLAGLAAAAGLTVLMVRRWRSKEPELDYARAAGADGGYSRSSMVFGDWLFDWLLMFLFVTGFFLEALRIDYSGFPGFERWSWMGWVIARGMLALGIGSAPAGHIHAVLWWLHALAALSFVAYIPFSKAMHMLTSPANIAVTDPSRTRALPSPAETGSPSYPSSGGFRWNELLGFDACTKCGRCHAVCPARAAGAPLSPRDLVLDLRQWVDRESGIPAIGDRERRSSPTGPLAGAGAAVVGDVVSVQTLWSCTTCMACVEVCPVGVEHVPTIVSMRRSMVDRGEMDPSLQKALQNIAQQGNSFGKSSRMRARWTKGLEFQVKDARKEPVRYLWFVGDFASYDDRLQRLSQTLARLLHEAGVDFGLLFDDERNAGNDVRRVGEEGLFEMLVEHNMGALTKADYQEIFTTDPHSLNTLRNEYPAYGLDKPVRHYSEVLADLLADGTIPVRSLSKRVTYHDPCYLARYNRVMNAPRRVIEALGCQLVEMPRHGTDTFCCGAGGGRIWMDDSYLKERPSEIRIREAVGVGVEQFVVSCPKDYTMFSDAVKTTGLEGVLSVCDLVQLVDEASAHRPVEQDPVPS